MRDLLSQHSDNKFRTSITDAAGAIASSSLFTNAEYLIARSHGEILLRLTLGNGIERDGDDFVTTIDDSQITFRGNFTHQFVVYDAAGNKLPPVFNNPLTITQTLIQEIT